MRRPLITAYAVLATGAGLALSSCGGSSSTSSPAAGTSPTASGTSSTPTSQPISGGGGSFCQQILTFVGQIRQIGSGAFGGASPGATPNPTAYKQFFATITSAVDSLDGSAPGEIASSFHTLRASYDQANAVVQNATTFEQMASAFSGLDSPAIKGANTNVQNYLTSTCGLATPTP